MEDKSVKTVWQSCSINCGCHCPLRLKVKDGRVLWVESDVLPEDEDCPQMRACLRGRSLGDWLSAPTRLNYPLKRTGPRGSGQFERISWDEALDEIAAQLKRIVSTYGNQAVFVPYGTGLYPAEGSPFERLLNSYGGYLAPYGDYSCAQLQGAMKYLYGDDGYYTGSVMSQAKNADLVILFGNTPSDTRMGGASVAWELIRAREQGSFKLVSIDPRYTATNAGHDDEWIPLYPGTDAALVCGLAYVLITEDLIDEEFLHTYCVGYDQETMPEGAPPHGSYKDYILGKGEDALPKTPKWASAITGVPEARIVSLARRIGKANRVFVAQGWGPQRHDNGELTARAIPLLAILTGNIGLPGTNSGARERFLPFALPCDDVKENPVKARIPVFMWTAAVERSSRLTAENAGIMGAPFLQSPIKMIVNHAGNCLINQHADINNTHRILSDESLCEFIVACDIHLTSSVKYADIVLPDIARAEKANVVSSGSADKLHAVVKGASWDAEQYERRDAWDVCLQLSERLGCRDSFTSQPQGALASWDESLETASDMDAWRCSQVIDGDLLDASGEDAPDGGTFMRKKYEGEEIAYRLFREDPAAHPLPTPSGKIEIYSQRLADLAKVIQRDEDQVIHPLPVFAPAKEGRGGCLQDEYPYQLIGFHGQRRVHSCFDNVDNLDMVLADGLLMNPLDAQVLGVFDRSEVIVSNQRGSLKTPVRVTPGIMPGVVALAQGSWYQSDNPGFGVDEGGCINTLTSQRATALTRGNPQNSILVRIERCGYGEEGSVDG